ncbi:MAG: hypothetical protein LH474_12670 [Chamaesiphon sp.]|nr:hypothetical protein [Chamaesiphon sp.]
MNKYWFYLGVISSLSILTTSCGGDSKPPTPAASPAAVAPAATTPAAPAPVATSATTPTTKANPAATTAKPVVPGKTPVAIKPVSVDVAAGLIPPTDGESWAKTVAKGRPDPFGMLSLQPITVIEPIDPLVQVATPRQPSAKVATNNTAGSKPSVLPTIKIATSPTKTTKGSGNQKIASSGKNQPVTISAIPRTGVNRALPKIIVALKQPVIGNVKATAKVVSNSKVIAAKPERIVEKPLQAMAVEISGVIEVAGRTQVIVKLPTESFSRYIEVGERLADGKVLIKRVEGQNSLSPTVVLEEVGVEVPRKIGDKPTESAIIPAPIR